MIKQITATAVATAMALLVGCNQSPRPQVAATEGERLEYQAAVLRQKAEMIQKGEKLIADGRATVARGQAMKDQGNTLEGQNLIIEGEARIREGQNYLAQADAVLLPNPGPNGELRRDPTRPDPTASVPQD